MRTRLIIIAIAKLAFGVIYQKIAAILRCRLYWLPVAHLSSSLDGGGRDSAQHLAIKARDAFAGTTTKPWVLSAAIITSAFTKSPSPCGHIAMTSRGVITNSLAIQARQAIPRQ